MANTLQTSNVVLREFLRILKNTLSMSRAVPRQYSAEFARTGAKVGQTVNVKKPPRYEGRRGAKAKIENTKETLIPVTLSNQVGVDIAFSSIDRTLSIDGISQLVQPIAAKIANDIDYDLCQTGELVANAVGTPGTTPTTLDKFLYAGALLTNLGTPHGDRYAMLPPDLHAAMVGNNLTLLNPSNAVSEQYRTGQLAQFGGFKFYEDVNQPQHTVGALGGTPLVNTAGQSGSSLVTDGWTSAAATRLKKGDIFTIGTSTASLYAVNPQSRQSTGALKQFCVAADAASDSSGNMTIPLVEPIVPAGQFQNVVSSPADNAAITVLGSANTAARYGLCFHKDFATIAFADLELPRGVHEASRISDPDSGISIRMVTAYSIEEDQLMTRFDVLYGIAVPYPEMACRIYMA